MSLLWKVGERWFLLWPSIGSQPDRSPSPVEKGAVHLAYIDMFNSLNVSNMSLYERDVNVYIP